jgi:DNA repair exonuclease SbcCD nuclease subunit
MLVGNHDAFYKDRSDVNSMSILRGWPNIAIVQDTSYVMNHGKTVLSFIPWGVDGNDLPSSDIMFGHFEIENFRLNSSFVCKHGIKSNHLLSKAKLVISGHFHTREEREFQSGNIIYVGNPYQMDFGDTKQTKGIYVVDISNKTYEFKPNKVSPTHEKILLSGLIEHGDIDDTIKAQIRNNIVRFVVDKNIAPDEIDQLLRLLSSYKPLSLTTDYNINFDRFGLDEQDTDLSGISIESAIEEFVNLLDIDNKSKVIKYTTELYNKCK